MSFLNKHTTSRDVEDFLRVWVTLPTYTYLDPLTMTFRTTSLRLSCAHQRSAVFPQAMRVHCPSENSARTVFVPCCTSCRTIVYVRRREIVPSRAQVADNLCRAAAALPHPPLRLLCSTAVDDRGWGTRINCMTSMTNRRPSKTELYSSQKELFLFFFDNAE